VPRKDLDLATRWTFPDHDLAFRTTLRNGVFTHVRDGQGDVQMTISVPRPALVHLATGDIDGALAAGMSVDGDQESLKQLLATLDPGDPNFNIIEP
jgi:alkyl sulfatase BDS1-like metallo-beta-lactamase superfamily hydrolase